MIDEMREALSQHSTRIDEVDYNDPMVVLAGPGWSLSVACPWRLMQGSELEASYGDDGAAAVLGRLVGRAVVDIGSGGSVIGRSDIHVVLDDGSVLEVLPDTDLDPWVLRLSDRTFVGSASCA